MNGVLHQRIEINIPCRNNINRIRMASGNTFFEVYVHIWNGESVIKTASPFACILTEDGQKITQFTPASSGETTNVIYDGQYHIVFRFNVNLPKGRHRLMFKINSTYYHEIELICEDNICTEVTDDN